MKNRPSRGWSCPSAETGAHGGRSVPSPSAKGQRGPEVRPRSASSRAESALNDVAASMKITDTQPSGWPCLRVTAMKIRKSCARHGNLTSSCVGRTMSRFEPNKSLLHSACRPYDAERCEVTGPQSTHVAKPSKLTRRRDMQGHKTYEMLDPTIRKNTHRRQAIPPDPPHS